MARAVIIAYSKYAHDSRIKRHARALAERGDGVDVICLANTEVGYRDGVNVIGIEQPRYRGSSRLSYMRSYIRFFVQAATIAFRRSRTVPYDIAIACSIPDAVVLSALPCRLFGTKIILDIHDTMPELYMERFGDRRGRFGARLLSFQERASTMFADRVFAVHELHRRRLEDSGVRSDKIDVVMNVADPRLFAPLRRPAENAGPFIITCHGTVTRRLGIDIAIEAVAMLRERIPALRFNIMGGGDYSAEAAALVEKLDLGERVKFPPTVPVEKLPEVLSSTSIGIVPNISNSATNLMLPVKLLDYAALGIPIVAARLQTIEYYFGDGAVAFFEPGNVADLARVIEELYHSPERRLDLARKAQEKLAKIDFASQRTAFYRAVNSLIGSKATSRADAPLAPDMNPSAERATVASIPASKQSNVAGQAVMH